MSQGLPSKSSSGHLSRWKLKGDDEKGAPKNISRRFPTNVPTFLRHLQQRRHSPRLIQISFEPGFGAYQGLAPKKQKCPCPGSSPSFCSSESLGAISKPAPTPGTHQTPVEKLSNLMHHRSSSVVIEHHSNVMTAITTY